ncbi:hypothetical protein [Photobacterium kishitanii]|uniref:Uncharacterized protein n=1 Tax=Photobacterium kishitanii TaxID=318456 RepID=A0A2T3KMD6_9GAMM|nr:hypothetical protein [Photobacterium kishitanii]PSV00944.1 hypothetical protein C9J27_02660 [Photobacterium kishitanii]
MFTLHPEHRDFFELQINGILIPVWRAMFDVEVLMSKYQLPRNEALCSVAEGYSAKEKNIRKKVFGLSGNNLKNAIAEMLGHQSYSALLSTTNSNTKCPQALGDYIATLDKNEAKIIDIAVSNRIKSSIDSEAMKPILLTSLDEAISWLPTNEKLSEIQAKLAPNTLHLALLLASSEFSLAKYNNERYLEEEQTYGDQSRKMPITPSFNSEAQLSTFIKDNWNTYINYYVTDDSFFNVDRTIEKLNALC